MAQRPEIDIQAQNVLRGLSALEDLLNQPIAREALDIANIAKTASMQDDLRRLKRSLTQYLEREGDLYYVGLLGHFSTGKSSTINSLLGLWSQPLERSTGLNPTDTTITLITNQKNGSSLLGVIREGHVAIRYQAVEAPLLTNIVIADTPGTGDPHLIEEIARDFLPICDVVLFLFSAASPLDQTDIPLLRELHNQLPFIPIKFVVTRADELRADRMQPVSEGNIDSVKRSQFLAEVIVRVNKLLSPQVYTEGSFILIDNKSGYNIDGLSTYLAQRADPSDPSARISMHSHKLNYYLVGAKKLRAFFAHFLDDKLIELTKIVKAAESNVLKYNELVRISNHNLTKAWADQLARIRETRDSALNEIQPLPPLPDSLETFGVAREKRAEVIQRQHTHATSLAQQVASRLRHNLRFILRDCASDVRGEIEKVPLEKLGANSHGLKPMSVNPELNVDLMPVKQLSQDWLDIRAGQARGLEITISDFRHKIRRAHSAIQSRQILTATESEVVTATDSLRADLRRFLETVQLYRDGVFSHRTKESISTLGIGRQLDELEAEFADDDKDVYTSEAIVRMFPDFASKYNSHSDQLAASEQKLRILIESMKECELQSPSLEQITFTLAAQTAEGELRDMIGREFQADVDQLIENLSSKLSSSIAENKALYDFEISRAKTNRIHHYLRAILAGGSVALLGYAGYHYLKQPTSLSLFATLGWGVVANLIGDVIGYGVARFRDGFSVTVKQVRDRITAKIREDIRLAFDAEIESHQFTSIGEGKLAQSLVQAHLKMLALGTDTWSGHASSVLSSVRKVHSSYHQVRNECVRTVQTIYDTCASYFNNPEHNLNVLNAVAGLIKEQAIEPSSSLLEKTRVQLSSVKNEIEAVEFA